jgi:8-oxo-dGTP diphosphatase
VRVVHAPGEGDDTIAALAEANQDVVVVTADRGLAGRIRAANGEVVGPSWLLDQLVEEGAGCRHLRRRWAPRS